MSLEKPILVSIIINNYNYGRFLQDAIDSALKQTYPHIEVIVVDDGSTDNSREIIASYTDKIVPVLKENGGQASAFNAGFAACKGDIICMLDSDDIFLHEKVEKVVTIFKQHKDIGWCSHSIKLVDIHTGITLKSTNQGLSRKCDFRLHLQKGKMPFGHPATSGLCFQRSLLNLILPMPEVIIITSDNYLKLTASALSTGFFLDEQLTYQRWHGDNAYSYSNDKQQLKAKIKLLTAYWVRLKLPAIAKYTNKLFAIGLGTYWNNGGVDAESNQIVKGYMSSVSLVEKLEIDLRAIYYWAKGKFKLKSM